MQATGTLPAARDLQRPMAGDKDNAVKTAGAMLRSMNHGESFWSGEPWKLWMTEGPNDAGKRLSELEFTGRCVA
jgi:hypothetical protein